MRTLNPINFPPTYYNIRMSFKVLLINMLSFKTNTKEYRQQDLFYFRDIEKAQIKVALARLAAGNGVCSRPHSKFD